MKKIEREIKLNNVGLEEALAAIDERLEKKGIKGKDALRIRFTLEEMLLRIRDRFGEDMDVTLSIGKRFGTETIKFKYAGESFDPRENQDGEMGEWTDRILSNLGLAPNWSYRRGRNELIQTISKRELSGEILMAIALVLAIILGLAGGALPQGTKEVITTVALNPISEIFLRLLNTLVGPLVFLSIITGICGIGDAAEFGRIGKRMISRFMLFSFIGGALAIAASPLFSISSATAVEGESQMGKIMALIMDIIPGNIIEPFLQGNMLQLIFMAVVAGVITLWLGERGTRLRDIFADLNDLIMSGVQLVCVLLPLYIFCSFTLQIWENGMSTLLGFWKPIVIFSGLCLIVFVFKIVTFCAKMKVPVSKVMKKVWPSMIVGFSTASSSAAFGVCTKINEEEMGIAPSVHRIGYPIGIIMYATVNAMSFVLTGMFAAEAFGAASSLEWFVMLWFVGTVVSIATPPVAGGTLACIGIMLTQLGVEGQALAISGVLIMLLDFIATGTRLGMLHMELALQADYLGLLDKDILNK